MNENEARDSIRRMGFHTAIRKLLEAYPPIGAKETIEIIEGLTKGLAATTAFEAYQHIEDHKGYACAQALIDNVVEDLRLSILSTLNNRLEFNGRSSMRQGLEPSLNEQTRNQILKEMDS